MDSFKICLNDEPLFTLNKPLRINKLLHNITLTFKIPIHIETKLYIKAVGEVPIKASNQGNMTIILYGISIYEKTFYIKPNAEYDLYYNITG